MESTRECDLAAPPLRLRAIRPHRAPPPVWCVTARDGASRAVVEATRRGEPGAAYGVGDSNAASRVRRRRNMRAATPTRRRPQRPARRDHDAADPRTGLLFVRQAACGASSEARRSARVRRCSASSRSMSSRCRCCSSSSSNTGSAPVGMKSSEDGAGPHACAVGAPRAVRQRHTAPLDVRRVVDAQPEVRPQRRVDAHEAIGDLAHRPGGHAVDGEHLEPNGRLDRLERSGRTICFDVMT